MKYAEYLLEERIISALGSMQSEFIMDQCGWKRIGHER
jgi:hypothetical protein